MYARINCIIVCICSVCVCMYVCAGVLVLVCLRIGVVMDCIVCVV